MGYRTDFTITILDDINKELLGDSPRVDEIDEFFVSQKMSEEHTNTCREKACPTCEDYVFSIFDRNEAESLTNSFSHEDSMKWYEHEEDMKRLSNKFKDVLFELNGVGEEDDDKWKKYFLNGLMQVCPAKITIEYPKFDLKRMR